MTPSASNRVIIAAAGSRKTQSLIDSALAEPDKRVLITTYTTENLEQIQRRIQDHRGVIPANITLMGWFTFLINQASRPYQSALTDEIDMVRALNFVGVRPGRPKRDNVRAYHFDSRGNLYRDWVADFACRVDAASAGAAIRRLEQLYDRIYIDELQDLVGYDLEFMELLFASTIETIAVGDPRQHTFATSNTRKHKGYRGAGLMGWVAECERKKKCVVESRTESWRCNQAVCDFGDALYPALEPTTSRNDDLTGHDGIFRISAADVPAYAAKYSPIVLRHDKRADTMGLDARNIGVSKGSTFDRVLIFPTDPMKKYLKHRDPTKLKAPDKLYIAVTRALHSVAFVVDHKDADYIP